MFKKILCLDLFFGLLLSMGVQAQTKKEKVEQLLELTGSKRTMTQVAGTMLNSFKKVYSQVDESVWDKFLKEMNTDELIGMIVPIYDKYYTEEDFE